MTSEHYDTKKLKKLRGNRSLRGVAAEMSAFLGKDVPHNNVARAERGAKGEGITYEFLCELARFYGVPVGELLYAVKSAA